MSRRIEAWCTNLEGVSSRGIGGMKGFVGRSGGWERSGCLGTVYSSVRCALLGDIRGAYVDKFAEVFCVSRGRRTGRNGAGSFDLWFGRCEHAHGLVPGALLGHSLLLGLLFLGWQRKSLHDGFAHAVAERFIVGLLLGSYRFSHGLWCIVKSSSVATGAWWRASTETWRCLCLGASDDAAVKLKIVGWRAIGGAHKAQGRSRASSSIYENQRLSKFPDHKSWDRLSF